MAHANPPSLVDIRNPAAPTLLDSIAAPGANSVAVNAGLVAIAQQSDLKTDPGVVAFYDAGSYAERGRVSVGALPGSPASAPWG
ncbi:MAG: hypothetical protein V9G19_12415 [Tetrasphaera sp.]